MLGIMGILSTFAYPSYTKHMTHARRIDGQTALLDLAIRLERHMPPLKVSPGGWYDLEVHLQTDSTYLLKAIPKGAQAKHDTRCQTLTLASNGLQSITAGPNGISPEGPLTACW